MSWRDAVTYWFSDKTLNGSLTTQGPIDLLIERDIVPTELTDNTMLHSIIFTQIVLEVLNNVTTLQNGGLVYKTNAKETMMWDLTKKNEEQVIELEVETGVNLNYYHRLGIKN